MRTGTPAPEAPGQEAGYLGSMAHRKPLFVVPLTMTVSMLAASAPPAAPAPPPNIRFDGWGCLEGPAGKENSVVCPEELLTKPPPGTPVYENSLSECRTLGGKRVRCPPNVTLPSSGHVNGLVHVALDDNTLSCHTWTDYTCDPNVTCNPPHPEPIACPDDLLPRLLPGVAPTAKKNGQCFLGDTRVACPS